jgi:predicted metal-dependent HD superfamily phosphohydrolase
MTWPSAERWIKLWNAVHASGDPLTSYEELKAAYAEPRRHYHTQQHIAECLLEFDAARHLTQRPEEVEMALWFHDVVYDPKAANNEEKSVVFAKQRFAKSAISDEFAERVGQLIMSTKTHESNADSDAAVLIDVDLSILGRDEKRFSEYEGQIRQEYAWVPAFVYRIERAKILRRFLSRANIFVTEWFRDKYEDTARRNLQFLLKKMGQ